MDTEQFTNKKYSIPRNVPVTTSHKYLEVIEKECAKYIEIIHLCGNFIMYKQFYQLVESFEPNLKKSSTVIKAKEIIKNLLELGFIENQNINMNKFIYLKKPAFALTEGDYNCNCRINLNTDLKNDKFQISILKVEYLLTYGEIIHSSSMFNQLMTITTHIYNTINKQGNSYGYSIDTVEEIIKMNDFQTIKNLVDNTNEFTCKLGILRGLWSDLGAFYRKLLLQKQTISQNPVYYKLYIKKSGEIILHLIVNILIFDVSHDKKYYKDKSEKLFHAFYSIHGNELRNVQEKYLDNTTMGYEGENHMGYIVTLIGADEEILNEKKSVIDDDIESSVNSPIMGSCRAVGLPISKYLLHSSRKKDSYKGKQDRQIDNLIQKQLNRINGEDESCQNVKRNGTNEGKKLLGLLNYE